MLSVTGRLIGPVPCFHWDEATLLFCFQAPLLLFLCFQLSSCLQWSRDNTLTSKPSQPPLYSTGTSSWPVSTLFFSHHGRWTGLCEKEEFTSFMMAALHSSNMNTWNQITHIISVNSNVFGSSRTSAQGLRPALLYLIWGNLPSVCNYDTVYVSESFSWTKIDKSVLAICSALPSLVQAFDSSFILNSF